MAGYLDKYGAGEERREKSNKLILSLGAAVLVLLFLWFFFFVWDKTEMLRVQSVARLAQVLRNHRQESRVKSFFDLLQQQDYKAAYALWNCTDRAPLPRLSLFRVHEGLGPRQQAQRRSVHTFPGAVPAARA